MTVKDVVELSAVYLQLEDVLSKSEFSSSINKTTNPSVTSDELTDRSLNLLVRCTDLVLSEIASDFVHLTKTETIQTESEEVPYSKFSSQVLKIIDVKENDRKIKFKQFPTFVQTSKTGNLVFTYNYLPSNKTSLSSSIDEIENLVSTRTIAYGVAREYCYISGLYAEGEMWDEKFKNSLVSRSLSTSKTVKARRWA